MAVACALVSDPELLFLDEPTTGLDPQSRLQLWDVVDAFKKRGRTVLLTTHYMDEAQRLCDRVGVVDHGKLIALGSPRELIASLGAQEVIELSLARGTLDEAAVKALPGVHGVHHTVDGVSLKVDPFTFRSPPWLTTCARSARSSGGWRRGTRRWRMCSCPSPGEVCVTPAIQLSMSSPPPARLRQFLREPGALFWSFGFPVLLSLALGVAFRSWYRPPEAVSVAILSTPDAPQVLLELASPRSRPRLWVSRRRKESFAPARWPWSSCRARLERIATIEFAPRAALRVPWWTT